MIKRGRGSQVSGEKCVCVCERERERELHRASPDSYPFLLASLLEACSPRLSPMEVGYRRRRRGEEDVGVLPNPRRQTKIS
jgi:hypothetical protein